MSIQIESYLFFLIFIPIIVLGAFILKAIKGDKYKYHRYFLVCAILLIGHIILPFANVGIFPDLKYDILFYALLLLGGTFFIYFNIRVIEEKKLKEIGWDSKNPLKDIVIGLIFGLILLIISALLLTPFQSISTDQISISIEKVIVAILFSLGAIYEEWYFRGFKN